MCVFGDEPKGQQAKGKKGKEKKQNMNTESKNKGRERSSIACRDSTNIWQGVWVVKQEKTSSASIFRTSNEINTHSTLIKLEENAKSQLGCCSILIKINISGGDTAFLCEFPQFLL
jgi:hypothetical protein